MKNHRFFPARVVTLAAVGSLQDSRLAGSMLFRVTLLASAWEAFAKALPVLRRCVTSLAGVGKPRNWGRAETILFSCHARAQG